MTAPLPDSTNTRLRQHQAVTEPGVSWQKGPVEKTNRPRGASLFGRLGVIAKSAPEMRTNGPFHHIDITGYLLWLVEP